MLFELEEDKKKGLKVEKKTFKELQMDEVHHLQEIIANNTQTLGEEFLIIQKEYQGFDNTKERLDLLALDKNKNLVVIENKLDDSGKDVTWQIIKYASYVSSFTKDEILKIFQDYLEKQFPTEKKYADDELANFYEIEKEDIGNLILNDGNTSQRLILVAGNFRKEITSSVLWLMNYGLNIQCIKAIPYKSSDNKIFLDMQQIIPVKDVEDYVIKIADKEKRNQVVKKASNEVYTKSHHLDDISEDTKEIFLDLEKYILKKMPELEENYLKYYIGFKLGKQFFDTSVPYKKDVNFFGIGFNVNSIFLNGLHGYNTQKRILDLNRNLDFTLEPYYSNNNDKKIDYGRLRLKIENNIDLEKAKKIISYYTDNQTEELKKRNKEYYKN